MLILKHHEQSYQYQLQNVVYWCMYSVSMADEPVGSASITRQGRFHARASPMTLLETPGDPAAEALCHFIFVSSFNGLGGCRCAPSRPRPVTEQTPRRHPPLVLPRTPVNIFLFLFSYFSHLSKKGKISYFNFSILTLNYCYLYFID